jgi:hypothetical protein
VAVGKSHRIVIEVNSVFKQKIYVALNTKGMALKDWFLEQTSQTLLQGSNKSQKLDRKE